MNGCNKHDCDTCTRTLVKIADENFYLVVGETFVMCTVPRENDPIMSEKRMIVETLCGAITAQMENRAEFKNQHTQSVLI